MKNPKLERAVGEFNRIIDMVENRCQAADGPVVPTISMIQQHELRKLWLAVKTIQKETR